MIRYLQRKFSDPTESTSKLSIISALVTKESMHSILDSLYIYKYNKSYYGYILQDKRTREIIAIDCGDSKTQYFNIRDIANETGGSFSSLFLTSKESVRSQGVKDLRTLHPNLKIYHAGDNDGNIEYVGDLCIYTLHTPGPTEFDTSYVITEVNEKSDKTPIVFTGDVLLTGGCGKALYYDKFYQSLAKLKSLPNETLIFPGLEAAGENLMFCKILDPNNPFVNSKLEEVKSKDMNIGQQLSQERLYNPFFRCDQKYFYQLFEANDPVMCFTKMKKMMEKLVEIKAGSS
jgi:hydroxyacylglutathione hydrolase